MTVCTLQAPAYRSVIARGEHLSMSGDLVAMGRVGTRRPEVREKKRDQVKYTFYVPREILKIEPREADFFRNRPFTRTPRKRKGIFQEYSKTKAPAMSLNTIARTVQ